MSYSRNDLPMIRGSVRCRSSSHLRQHRSCLPSIGTVFDASTCWSHTQHVVSEICGCMGRGQTVRRTGSSFVSLGIVIALSTISPPPRATDLVATQNRQIAGSGVFGSLFCVAGRVFNLSRLSCQLEFTEQRLRSCLRAVQFSE